MPWLWFVVFSVAIFVLFVLGEQQWHPTWTAVVLFGLVIVIFGGNSGSGLDADTWVIK